MSRLEGCQSPLLRIAILISLTLWIGNLAGCSSPEAPVDSVQETGVATIARLYGEYAAQHQGKGPADAASFRSFLENLPAAQREGMGLQDIDKALTSVRDGQPLVVVYGVDTQKQCSTGGVQKYPVVVHESQGRDGKRLVANGFGVTQDVDASEFSTAINGR